MHRNSLYYGPNVIVSDHDEGRLYHGPYLKLGLRKDCNKQYIILLTLLYCRVGGGGSGQNRTSCVFVGLEGETHERAREFCAAGCCESCNWTQSGSQPVHPISIHQMVHIRFSLHSLSMMMMIWVNRKQAPCDK